LRFSRLKNARFVSGHRFSDAVTAAKSFAPSQDAEKMINRRLGFEGARLPAAPSLVLKGVRHGWKAVPFQDYSAWRVFFRNLFQALQYQFSAAC
jgi:hypothetical protein